MHVTPVVPSLPSLSASLRVAVLLTGAAVTAPTAAAQSVPQGNPGPLGRTVNMFTATGGLPWAAGSLSPAAQMPFGMVQLGPDTAPLVGPGQTNMRTSGYYYPDQVLWGFSHTRFSGTGASEGGLFRIVPRSLVILPGEREAGARILFSHSDEAASPGYYAVRLPMERLTAELTSTTHVGVHRYSFDPLTVPQLLLYASSQLYTEGDTDETEIRILPGSGEVEGKCRLYDDFSGRQGGLPAYFVASFDPPFSQWGTWREDYYANGSTFERGRARGESVGAQLNYSLFGPKVITVKVALSYVSIANARQNLAIEAPPGVDFDMVVNRSSSAWEDILDRIRLTGASATQRALFYTMLYRSLVMPTQFSDTNGEYPGFDGQTHTANGFNYYTNMSLWDTFRTVHPLLNLMARSEQRDMVVSLIEMAAQGGGYLPRWPSGADYTGDMIGDPADIVVAESYLKGITNFDVDSAYAAMTRGATTVPPSGTAFPGREGLASYLRSGYLPADQMEEAVSRSLEYAWADAAIGRLAAALGKDADAQLFLARSENHRNNWNPQSSFFQPRNADGTFKTPFYTGLIPVLTGLEDDYTQGSALQWRWPFHDGEGLVSLFGTDRFLEQLNSFFVNASPGRGLSYPGDNYWHGNEHDIHAAYLFNYAARPDKTQRWVRWILDTKYSLATDGLDGPDDAGTLSAWYVFSSLGFYPVAGTERYLIGTPLFGGRVDLGAGRSLTVAIDNPGSAHQFVQNVTLNGRRLDVPWFDHSEIAGGGTLRFRMGTQPSRWGTPVLKADWSRLDRGGRR